MRHGGRNGQRSFSKNEGGSNLLAKGVQSKLEKDVVHIDNGTSVGHLVKVLAHHLGLLHKNALSVVTEGLDVEDVRRHLALPFPLLYFCCVRVYLHVLVNESTNKRNDEKVTRDIVSLV